MGLLQAGDYERAFETVQAAAQSCTATADALMAIVHSGHFEHQPRALWMRQANLLLQNVLQFLQQDSHDSEHEARALATLRDVALQDWPLLQQQNPEVALGADVPAFHADAEVTLCLRNVLGQAESPHCQG